ncbi:hypothetical protein [Oryzifoliimicrobium ureilyticus]|uniref:hypothetical protein n=1 Tax=Oryzifoliimicrobium ureilyticus TaxID=3113724 RepID=UPI0030765159
MYRTILAGLFAFVSAAQAAPLSEAQKKATYFLPCAALYGVVARVYEQAGDTKNAALAKEKFDRLAQTGKADVVAGGETAEKADQYLQQHIDSIVKLAEKDSQSISGFKKVCDEKTSG